MRKILLSTGLAVAMLASAAYAQDTPAPTDVPDAAQPAATAAGDAAASAATQATDAAQPPAAYNAAPAPEMAPANPVVENAPAPPAEYPVCGKGVTDGCVNPADAPRGKAKAKPRA